MNTSSASVRHEGDVAIVVLSGRVALGESASKLRDMVKGLLESGQKNILLDLSAVPYIDSTGLGELSSAHIAAARRGGAVKLVHTQPKVASLLRLTKLDSMLVTYPNESAALESFR